MTDTLAPPAPTEDPRIAARRLEVVGGTRRRRRVVLLVVGSILGVVSLAVGLLRSPLFAVDRVVVTGGAAVDRAAVVTATGVRPGDAIVDVDPGRVRAAVMALPMVASARVERDWPDTVRVVVTDEVPLATLAAAGRTVLVGRGGRILADAAGSGSQAKLPRIDAADGVLGSMPRAGATLPDAVLGAVVVLEQLPARVAGRLAGVAVAPSGALSLKMGDGSERVDVGPAEDLPAKLLAIESVLAAVDLDCLDVLDVRDPTRPTITRRAGCTLAPPTVGTAPTTTTVPTGRRTGR